MAQTTQSKRENMKIKVIKKKIKKTQVVLDIPANQNYVVIGSRQASKQN